MSAQPKLPHVRVLIATHNGTPWLDEQLRSIFGQEGMHVSLLASDDQSTDGTPAVLADWSRRSSALQILPSATSRLGAAANFVRLLRETRLDGVDFVALADQDDIWQPARLARALALLGEHGADGYSSDVLAFWADGRRKPLGKAHPQRALDHLFEPAGPGCTYVLNAALASALQRELKREPQRFDGIGYHDWLIYAFARLHDYRWFIDPEPGVLYRQHAHNELGANLGAVALTRRWGRLTSGWFRGQVLRIATFWPGAPEPLVTRLRRLSVLDRIWLALRVRQLRRHPRDQFALAAMLLLGVIR
jgi:rhamnosyltransferase